jgi:hypothetical protein
MTWRKTSAGKLFSQVSLEALVPDGHLLRRVAEAVDFGVARRVTARFYSHTGQPSVDPVVLFTLALLGDLDGLPSGAWGCAATMDHGGRLHLWLRPARRVPREHFACQEHLQARRDDGVGRDIQGR